MKILIVKLSSIGDIIHTLPVLAAIRRALPRAEISWAAEARMAEVLRGNELLKHLIEVDTRSLRGGKIIEEILLDAGRQIKNLRVSGFDIALDFQGLFKSAAIAKLSKAKKRFGFDKENLREPMSRFLLTDTVKVEQGIHVVRKNLALAEKALNIKVSTGNFEFPIFTNEEHKKDLLSPEMARRLFHSTNLQNLVELHLFQFNIGDAWDVFTDKSIMPNLARATARGGDTPRETSDRLRSERPVISF